MSGSEKRTYFRVKTEMALACQPLTAEQYQVWHQRIMTDTIPPSDGHHQFLLLDTEILNAIEKLAINYPQVATVLTLFNRKLNLVSKGGALAKDNSQLGQAPYQMVDLSATGLRFMSADRYTADQCLLVECIVPPQEIFITLIAKIVRCEATDRGYEIAALFDTIRVVDQERLIQRVMQAEMSQIRSKKYLKQA
jgi:hypothetical protein